MKRNILISVVLLLTCCVGVIAKIRHCPTEPEIKLEIQRQKTAVAVLRAKIKQTSSLRNYYVVIDPGHGDGDPGAIRDVEIKKNTTISVSESVLTLDISRRLAWNLRQHGCNVFMTLGPTTITEAQDTYAFWHPFSPPFILKELKPLLSPSPYAYTPLEQALTTRTEVANQKVRRFGKRKVLFTSIHVDSTTSSVSGMRIYSYYGTRSHLSDTLAKTAKEKKMARVKRVGNKEFPFFSSLKSGFIVINPDFNYAQDKVLIETANIRNDADFKLLCTAEGRERIAQTIAEGIILYVSKKR